MNAEGLLMLAEFLEKLPPKRFKYDRWVGKDWKGRQDLSCGTSACALGWAATMPKFRKAGLRFKKVDGVGLVCMKGTKPSYYDLGYSLIAAEQVFDISFPEANFLFIPGQGHAAFPWEGPSDRASAKTVANHIRKFVFAKLALMRGVLGLKDSNDLELQIVDKETSQ